MATGATVQALLGASLLKRMLGKVPIFRRATDVFRLSLACTIACAIKATLGFFAELLFLHAHWEPVRRSGSAYGREIWRDVHLHSIPARLGKATLILERSLALDGGCPFLITLFVAGWFAQAPSGQYPIKFFLLPVMLWAGFRFEAIGVSTAVVLVSGMAVIGCAHRFGPFKDIPYPSR